MLSFSKTTGYAVNALSCLDGPGGQRMTVKNLACCTGISQSYLSKIIQILVKKGFVQSKRGYTGGMLLVRPAEEISLKEIVEAMEDTKRMPSCLMGMNICGGICPMHEFWKNERDRIETELFSRKLVNFACYNVYNPTNDRFLENLSALQASNQGKKE